MLKSQLISPANVMVATSSKILEGQGFRKVFPKDFYVKLLLKLFRATRISSVYGRKTYEQFNLSILKPPPAVPRLVCPNDFIVHEFDIDNIGRIGSAKACDVGVRDGCGKVRTPVFVKWRTELDQLLAQYSDRGGSDWDDT